MLRWSVPILLAGLGGLYCRAGRHGQHRPRRDDGARHLGRRLRLAPGGPWMGPRRAARWGARGPGARHRHGAPSRSITSSPGWRSTSSAPGWCGSCRRKSSTSSSGTRVARSPSRRSCHGRPGHGAVPRRWRPVRLEDPGHPRLARGWKIFFVSDIASFMRDCGDVSIFTCSPGDGAAAAWLMWKTRSGSGCASPASIRWPVSRWASTSTGRSTTARSSAGPRRSRRRLHRHGVDRVLPGGQPGPRLHRPCRVDFGNWRPSGLFGGAMLFGYPFALDLSGPRWQGIALAAAGDRHRHVRGDDVGAHRPQEQDRHRARRGDGWPALVVLWRTPCRTGGPTSCRT